MNKTTYFRRRRRKRKEVDNIMPDELAARRVRWAIVHAAKVMGRSKTAILLETWVRLLRDDHSNESRVIDSMREEATHEDSPLSDDSLV